MAYTAHNGVRACLIINPKSGRGRVDLSDAITVLQAHGWEVAVRQKLHGGGATELARDAAREGYTVVVDCGGDGTLNEIVEGVAGTGVAVGTIPGGTANLWAHEMGISHRPAVAALQLVGSEQRRVDVGRVAVNGHHKRHFLLLAGLGFDGAVLQHLSKPLKNRIGWMAYAPATLGALRSFRNAPVDAEMDEMHWHGRAAQIVLANTRRYAGFTRMSPWAYVDDGLFDICFLTPRNALSTAHQMGALLVRQRPSFASAQLYRAATVTIRSPLVLPLQVDGGSVHVGDDDLTPEGVVYAFTLKVQGVSVLVPRSYDGALFQPRRLAETLADIPLRPGGMHAGRDHDRSDGHNGHDGNEAKTWKMKVLAVGADTLTTARLKDGRVVEVVIDPDTMLSDEQGETQSLWGTLSALTEGDLVRVSGVKDPERGVVRAQKVTLASRTVEAKVHKPSRKR